jgi:cytochrome b6-f complex iron-sulfur subunit
MSEREEKGMAYSTSMNDPTNSSSETHTLETIVPEPGETATRRTFLAAAGAAGICYAAALAYPIYRYLASPEEMAMEATAVTQVTLKDAQKLPLGSVLMYKFGSSPALLIHHKDGRWTSMTAVCTHLGCTVQYETEADRIHCSCHGGVYDAYTGANVSGPPPKPLKLYTVAVHDAGVDVSRA